MIILSKKFILDIMPEIIVLFACHFFFPLLPVAVEMDLPLVLWSPLNTLFPGYSTVSGIFTKLVMFCSFLSLCQSLVQGFIAGKGHWRVLSNSGIEVWCPVHR